MAGSRAAEWQQLVRRWQKSGLSAWQFAEQHGLAPRTLTWWRWRLRHKQQTTQHEAANTKQKPQGKRPREEVPVAFVRVVAAEPTARRSAETEPAVEFVFGEVLVRVRRGFDSETLGRVLEVLEGQQRRPC